MTKTAKGALDPAVTSRTTGDLFATKKITALVIETVKNQPTEMMRRAKKMTETTTDAIELIKRVEAQAFEAVTKLADTSKQLEETGKEVSGKVRMHAEKMAAGLRKIHAGANFELLERHTIMLERMAEAMKTLAELESRGTLAKISAAIK